MTVPIQIWGLATVLRQFLRMVTMLVLATCVHSLFFLDITHGLQMFQTPPVTHSKTLQRLEPERYETVPLRSKRSMSVLPFAKSRFSAAIHPSNYLSSSPPKYVMHTPEENKMAVAQPHHYVILDPKQTSKGRRVMSVKKLYRKLRRISNIRDALRHRDKLQRTGFAPRPSRDLEELVLSEKPLKQKILAEEAHKMAAQKHRRAQIMEASRLLSIPKVAAVHANRHNSGFHQAPYSFSDADNQRGGTTKFEKGTFENMMFPPMMESKIEMFPKLESNNEDLFNNGFGPAPVANFHGGGGGLAGFRDDSFSSPLAKGWSSPQSQPIGHTREIHRGFSKFGAFASNDKDCDSIETKSCSSDLDCSCHGFYMCVRGRCDVQQTMLQDSKPRKPSGMWHDEPIDFGFSKRSLDNEESERIPAAPNEAGE